MLVNMWPYEARFLTLTLHELILPHPSQVEATRHPRYSLVFSSITTMNNEHRLT